MAFLHYWIFGLANVIGNQIALMVMVEKGIIKIVCAANKNPDIAEDIVAHIMGNFPIWRKLGCLMASVKRCHTVR
jgi:hypothetical protein